MLKRLNGLTWQQELGIDPVAAIRDKPQEPDRDCKHGQLARSCEICKRDQRLAESVALCDAISAERDQLRRLLSRIMANTPYSACDDGLAWARAKAILAAAPAGVRKRGLEE